MIILQLVHSHDLQVHKVYYHDPSDSHACILVRTLLSPKCSLDLLVSQCTIMIIRRGKLILDHESAL